MSGQNQPPPAAQIGAHVKDQKAPTVLEKKGPLFFPDSKFVLDFFFLDSTECRRDVFLCEPRRLHGCMCIFWGMWFWFSMGWKSRIEYRMGRLLFCFAGFTHKSAPCFAAAQLTSTLYVFVQQSQYATKCTEQFCKQVLEKSKQLKVGMRFGIVERLSDEL